jgi:hypothetical protein
VLGVGFKLTFVFDCFAECCRETSILFTKLDCYVCGQFVYCGVGSGGRVWVRWMGKRDQLFEAG